MTRVYISGPMTGLPECNFPAFHAAAAELRARGYEVANPAEINAETGGDWHFYLRADIKALCDCDAIVLLPGWENSKGAHLELHVAHRLGLRVSTLAAYGVRACGSNECIAGQRDGMICANGECDRGALPTTYGVKGEGDGCALCGGRGSYGIPGKRCEWCDGSGKNPPAPAGVEVNP